MLFSLVQRNHRRTSASVTHDTTMIATMIPFLVFLWYSHRGTASWSHRPLGAREARRVRGSADPQGRRGRAIAIQGEGRSNAGSGVLGCFLT